MGKGILKHGMKSGILPKARDIFKNPIKPVPIDPTIQQGYAPNVEPPKGTSRQPAPKKVVSVETLTQNTIPVPKNAVSETSNISESKLWKIKNAELRREYLQSSYAKEVKRLEKEEERKELLAAKEAEEEKISKAHTESAATIHTLPTISEFLRQPLMRPRTPEENEILQEKRNLNRMKTELIGKQNRAGKLLELYHASENFIVTEDKLELAIQSAFGDREGEYGKKVLLVGHKLTSIPDSSVQEARENLLSDSILGTIKGKAGLQQVEEYLSGHVLEVAKLASDRMAEKKQQEEKNIHFTAN